MVTLIEDCPACFGFGLVPADVRCEPDEVCETCEGTGLVYRDVPFVEVPE